MRCSTAMCLRNYRRKTGRRKRAGPIHTSILAVMQAKVVEVVAAGLVEAESAGTGRDLEEAASTRGLQRRRLVVIHDSMHICTAGPSPADSSSGRNQTFGGLESDAEARISDDLVCLNFFGANYVFVASVVLCEGIRNSLPPTWECRFVPIILGTMAIQERAFGDSMQQLGITKAGGCALMGTLMNILFEEQDKMLRSFQAQLCENA